MLAHRPSARAFAWGRNVNLTLFLSDLDVVDDVEEDDDDFLDDDDPCDCEDCEDCEDDL
jgi:hypothetical protein